jgi:hypothetical protein
MTAKKIQPTNPTVAPSEAKKADKNSARKTAAASSKHRKTAAANKWA